MVTCQNIEIGENTIIFVLWLETSFTQEQKLRAWRTLIVLWLETPFFYITRTKNAHWTKGYSAEQKFLPEQNTNDGRTTKSLKSHKQ